MCTAPDLAAFPSDRRRYCASFLAASFGTRQSALVDDSRPIRRGGAGVLLGSCPSSAKRCSNLHGDAGNQGVASAVAPAKPGIAILFSRAYRARKVLVAVPSFWMDIATYGIGRFTPIILGAIDVSAKGVGVIARDFADAEEALQSICFCCSVFLSEFGPSHDTGAFECRSSVSQAWLSACWC